MTKIPIRTQRMYLVLCHVFLLAAFIKPRKPAPNMLAYSFAVKNDQAYGVLEFDYNFFCDLADSLDATLDNASDPG